MRRALVASLSAILLNPGSSWAATMRAQAPGAASAVPAVLPGGLGLSQGPAALDAPLLAPSYDLSAAAVGALPGSPDAPLPALPGAQAEQALTAPAAAPQAALAHEDAPALGAASVGPSAYASGGRGAAASSGRAQAP
ncbi:MAG TPA: hypothetical protein VNI01_02855, partial [Elusimicrobiota bacterium]|nr:hypothetical protein [Elusimicrobiota bacterium]